MACYEGLTIDFFEELGLVDEAKAATEKWMARWIDVVSDP
jgi:hypothetical protein